MKNKVEQDISFYYEDDKEFFKKIDKITYIVFGLILALNIVGYFIINYLVIK